MKRSALFTPGQHNISKFRSHFQ